MRRYIPFLLLLALATTACKIRVDTAVVVNADESGTLSMEMSLDEEFRNLSTEGEALFDPTADFDDLPSGWSAEPFVDGEFEGVRIATDFDNLDDFKSKLADLQESSADGEGAPGELFNNLTLTNEGGTFSFRAEPEGLAEAAGGDDVGLEGLDPTAFFDSLFEIRMSVTLPGTLGDHNADTVDDNTLTWNIGLDDDGTAIFASSSSGGFSLNLPVLAVVALVLAAVATIAVARRERGQPVVAAPEEDRELVAVDGDPFAS